MSYASVNNSCVICYGEKEVIIAIRGRVSCMSRNGEKPDITIDDAGHCGITTEPASRAVNPSATGYSNVLRRRLPVNRSKNHATYTKADQPVKNEAYTIPCCALSTNLSEHPTRLVLVNDEVLAVRIALCGADRIEPRRVILSRVLEATIVACNQGGARRARESLLSQCA